LRRRAAGDDSAGAIEHAGAIIRQRMMAIFLAMSGMPAASGG